MPGSVLRSRKIRVAAFAVGGLLLLIALLLAALHTPPARRYALQQVVALLREQGIGFEASRLDYNLFGLRVDLRDVKVRSLQAPHLPPIVTAGRIWADLDLHKLTQGAYFIDAAGIENPQVRVVVDANGQDNLPHPPPKKSPSGTVDYLVRHLVISGGALGYDDRRQQLTLNLPLKRIAVEGNESARNHQVNLAALDGSASFAGRTARVRNLAGDFLVEKDAVQVRSLRLAFGDSNLNLSGTLNRFDDPRFDLKTQATLALASLAEFGGAPQIARGSVEVELTAKGPLASLQATARLRGDNLGVERFGGLHVDAEAAYDAASSHVRIRELNVVAPWARLRADSDVALLKGESTARFAAEGVDLDRVSAMLHLPLRIASTGAASGTARWPVLRFEEAAGDATARLMAARQAPAKDVLPVDAAIHATAQGANITIGVDSASALGAAASGQVVLQNRKALSGDLRVEAPHLAASIAAAEAFLGKPPGTLAGTPVDGKLTATAALSGDIGAPVAAVQLSVPDLSAGGLKGVAVQASANYTPDLLKIGGLTVTWQNQTVRAEGSVGMKPPQTLALKASSDQISIPAVLTGLNQGGFPVAGDLAFSADVTGTADAPQVTANATATNLQAYREVLGPLQLRAQMQGQRVEVPELRLGPLSGSGSYDLKSKQFQLQAQAEDFRLSNLTLPDGTAVRGVIGLDASMQGTVENPTGELKLTADEIQVADQAYGRAEISAKAANQQVQIEAAAPKYNLTATAKVGIADPNPATVQARIAQLDLAQLPMKLPVAGVVSAVIDAAGDLKNYQKGTARAEISSLDLKWNGESIRSDGPLVARYANDTLSVEKAAILAADSRLEISGSLPLEASAGDGDVRLSARLNLPGLAHFAPPENNLKLAGTATIDGSIRGTLKRVDPTLAIALDNASVEMAGVNPPVTAATLRGQIHDGALDLESASAKWGEASFQASGVIPFALLPNDLPVELPRKQGPARLTADLKGIRLEAIEGMPEGVSGAVSAHVEAEAARPELDAVKATLTFPELQGKLDTFAVAQNGASKITLDSGVVRIDRLQLSGPATEVQLSGTAQVSGTQALDLKLDGKLDAAVAAAFTSSFRARGATEIHAAVTGTAAKPDAKGFLQLSDAQFSLQQPRVGIDGLNLRVELDGSKATIANLDGQVNGGTLSGHGSIEYAGGKPTNADLTVQAEDLYLDFPAGLKTVSDVRLQLKSVNDLLALRGSVLVKEGGFTDDLNFDKGILAAATAPRSLDLTQERNRLLDSVRLNVSVITQDPIVVENNLAKAEISMQLVLLGSPYEPGLGGRLVIEEGSELTLQERHYEVSRGIITFTSERRIEPTMDILATTTASNYDITLQITGSPGDTKTQLTSTPSLPEPDILAILVTGKTLDEIRGQEFQVAQTQMLSYLTGRVGASLGRQVEKATGLSSVRVEPNLIAAETNPGARLTVGQDITRQLHLVYSMDLVNSSDQIYVAEYDLTKRFVTRGVRQSDGSYRFDFRHDLRFGGIAPPQRKRTDRRIGSLTISGESYFTEEMIRRKLKVKPGDRYDFFKLRRGLDRVIAMYTKASLLESNVRLKRDQKDGKVNVTLRADAGPKLQFVYEGASVPRGVRKDLQRVWYSGVFDTQRTEDATGVLRAWLIRQHHLTPEIKPEITNPSDDQKRVVFDIESGPKFEKVEWVFQGAGGLSQKELRGVVESQKLSTEVYTKPSRVTELLTQYYREMGFLDASLSEPKYELDGASRNGRVIFPVKEGQHYRVGEARFVGNVAIPSSDLLETAPLPSGEGYRPILRENALQRLREAYWARGYNDVDVEAEIERVPERSVLNMTFRITENAKGVVQDVTVEGNRLTSEGLIRSQLDFRRGDPVNLQKIANSRRKLYNTGAFAMVEISREDLAAPGTPGDHQVNLHVKVQEVQPWGLRYGAFYDTERGPGGIVDIENRNTLRSARVAGFRGRYDAQLQEARLYFSQPLLAGLPLKTTASFYTRREITPETDLVGGFNVDRVGFTLQQEVSLAKKIVFNYGYKIEKSRTYDTGPDPVFDIPLRIAALTATFSRETRDDLLDASKGSFFSHAIQFSPSSLGSELSFIKYFGQYFRYFPLQKPRVELFTNQVLRPRLVFASGVRVGLSRGLNGQEVPLSERFFAGGGTTIRGFEQNSVGPATSTGLTLGGEGMLVINNELRFPLISIFDGAGFVDIGNVYAKVSDFSLTDLRKAGGVGLRVRTPWFLIRLDYGIKLDRRTGESLGRIFFSIGQAF